MLTLFVVAAMCFFLYAEALIVSSQKVNIFEKLASFVCFLFIEAYYLMQLFERLGL